MVLFFVDGTRAVASFYWGGALVKVDTLPEGGAMSFFLFLFFFYYFVIIQGKVPTIPTMHALCLCL